jgi:hypothetical protein
MRTNTSLQVASPCHENWDKMTIAQKGRHCESCNKIVTDFSIMTDKEILQYISKQSNKLCGRFTQDQLQRTLIDTTVQKKKGWQWLVASVTSLFFFYDEAHAQNQTKNVTPVAISETRSTAQKVDEQSTPAKLLNDSDTTMNVKNEKFIGNAKHDEATYRATIVTGEITAFYEKPKSDSLIAKAKKLIKKS